MTIALLTTIDITTHIFTGLSSLGLSLIFIIVPLSIYHKMYKWIVPTLAAGLLLCGIGLCGGIVHERKLREAKNKSPYAIKQEPQKSPIKSDRPMIYLCRPEKNGEWVVGTFGPDQSWFMVTKCKTEQEALTKVEALNGNAQLR